MTCMCGDSECWSCGYAQGTRSVDLDGLADVPATLGWVYHAMGTHYDRQTQFWRYHKAGLVAVLIRDELPEETAWFLMIEDGGGRDIVPLTQLESEEHLAGLLR